MALFDFLSEFDTGNLARESKWNIIRAGVEIAVSENLSMSETARQLRLGGLSFGNEPFRDLFRELSGYRQQFDYQTRIGRDLFPNPDLMAYSKYPIEGEYGYVGRYLTTNPETFEQYYKTFRIDSDELLTQNQALAALQEFATKYGLEFEERLTDVEFIGSMKGI